MHFLKKNTVFSFLYVVVCLFFRGAFFVGVCFEERYSSMFLVVFSLFFLSSFCPVWGMCLKYILKVWYFSRRLFRFIL